MKKLLMLGTTLCSIEMLNYAKSKGVYTITTDYREPKDSVGKLISDEYWMISTDNIDALEAKCRQEHVTAILCGISEFNIEVAIELCKRLNLPFYCDDNLWHYSRDKYDFKKFFKECGVPLAEDYNVTENSSKEELDNIKYPVVVKPIDRCGNLGISYCYNSNELIEACKFARSVSKSDKLIIERMLVGKEWYSYYAIANGKIRQIALNAMEAEPGELKNVYSITTTITDCVEKFNNEINPKIENALIKMGCKEGIAWVQEMLDQDGNFYVIEMGYRLPGDLPFMLYPQMFGFDSIKWLVDYSLGEDNTPNLPPAQKHSFKSCACGYTLWTNSEGTIKKFIGFDDLEKIGDVHYYPTRKEGYHFKQHTVLVKITVYADTIEEFCNKIDKINKTISIINENDEDVIIRYTDFEYLKKTYDRGIDNESKF